MFISLELMNMWSFTTGFLEPFLLKSAPFAPGLMSRESHDWLIKVLARAWDESILLVCLREDDLAVWVYTARSSDGPFIPPLSGNLMSIIFLRLLFAC